jgi:signal transduction histidine kinase
MFLLFLSFELSGLEADPIDDGANRSSEGRHYRPPSNKQTGFSNGSARNESHCLRGIGDTGRGFHEIARETIFKQFEQRCEAGSRGYGGLGLALAISRQLVELLGGILTADSAGIGKGATFKLILSRA